MNPIGIHFGYWTQYWSSDPLDFVTRAKKCGFDVLEVNAPKVTLMSKAERDKLKAAAADAGLTLTYSIGMTSDMDLVSEEPVVRKKGIAFLQDLSKAMNYMGGRVMAGINYSSWPRKLLPGEDKRVLTDRAIAGVKEAIKAAEDNDVLFCVEVVNRFEQFMMNTAEEGVAFAERVGSPNCKILLDTFHMNIEEDSFRGSILDAGKWLGHFHLGESNRRPPGEGRLPWPEIFGALHEINYHFHLGESNRRPPGEGRLPWPEIFGALHEINYQGAVVMEPFLLPGGDVGRDISVFRDLLGNGDLDEKAARSVKFVRAEQQKVSG